MRINQSYCITSCNAATDRHKTTGLFIEDAVIRDENVKKHKGFNSREVIDFEMCLNGCFFMLPQQSKLSKWTVYHNVALEVLAERGKQEIKTINRRENSGALSVFMITDWSENWPALIAIWSLFAHLRESSDKRPMRWHKERFLKYESTLLSFLSSIQLKPLSQSYNIFLAQLVRVRAFD